MEDLRDMLKGFLVDYLESNMQFREWGEEIRLRNERKSNILQNIDSFLEKAEAGDPHAIKEIVWLGKYYPEITNPSKENLKQLESENKTNDKSSK